MAYEQNLSRGFQSDIDNTPIEDGKLRFAVDEARLFLDLKNERIEFTDFIKGLTQDEIFALENPLPKMYLSADTHQFMMYHAEEWVVFGDNAYDSEGQKVSSTYIKNVYYNDDGYLVKVFGDGTEEVISSSVAVAEKLQELDSKVQELDEYIEIIHETISNMGNESEE